MPDRPEHDRTTAGHDRGDSFPAPPTRPVYVQSPGDRVGPFRLLELIGEGGFGEVWLAEQKEPIARRVALKIIKPGMDSRAVIARFEQERQALALMDHPNIAKVLDAGATDAGRPFFAMELVKGLPITGFCDRERLTIEERLRLFKSVCDAVHHAHMKGVIHRDLKPSNILVTPGESGAARAVVIDFGVAKAIASRLTERTVFTERGQIIGTPEYMSPEQAEMAETDIDTRTDVYALGVVLYELLTGELPLDPGTLRDAGYAAIQRMIRETEPPRPSTRLSQVGERRGRAAEARRLSVADLTSTLRAELEWIPLKALRKERAERYRSAAELGDDIANFLEHRPLIAGPESASYRLKKFARRHRVGVVAGSLVGVSLIVGLGAAVWQASVAARERDAATLAAEEARRAGELAEERRRQTERVAEFQAAQLRGIDAEVMGRRLRELMIADAAAGLAREGRTPAEIGDATARLRDLLARANPTNIALKSLDENIFERALAAVHEQFADQPLVKARLLQTLSDTIRGLGLPDRALAPQEEALAIRRRLLGDDHPDTIWSINGMAVALESQGRGAEAEPLVREALERATRAHGPDSPQAISALDNLGTLLRVSGRHEEAEPIHRDVLERCRRVFGPEHEDTLRALNNVGVVLQTRGMFGEAEPYVREAMELHRRVLTDQHADTLTAIGNMGSLLDSMGRYDEAAVYYREALEKRRRILGDDHRETLDSVRRMGRLCRQQGLYAEALMHYTEAADRSRRVLGEDHPDTLDGVSGMGSALQLMGRYAEAEPILREALVKRRRILGEDHPETLDSLNTVGILIRSQGRFAEAEPYLRECVEKCRRILGEDHPTTLTRLGNLGVLLRDLRRFGEAEACFRETLERRRRVLGDDHPETISSLANLGAVLESQDRLDEAEALMREAAAASRRVLGDDHPDTLSTLSGHGAVLRALGRLDEAEPLLRAALEGRRSALGEDHPSTLISLANLGGLLRARGDLDGAESCFREVLERRRAALGDDHPSTLLSLTNLGVLLQQRGRLDDAAACFREVLDRRLVLGASGVPLGLARFSLGRVLAAQKQFAEAETLLLAAESDLTSQPSAHRECLAAIEELYGAWEAAEPGGPVAEKAAAWKERARPPGA